MRNPLDCVVPSPGEAGSKRAGDTRAGAAEPPRPCTLLDTGSDWGDHKLCERTPPEGRCVFYSFGISNDYSFDVDLAQRSGCQGFAFDPTVDHPALLHERPEVSFHRLAATTLNPEGDAKWHAVISVPRLRAALGHERVEVLKMDCEGCEYALARDVLAEEPGLFHRIGQFAVELHISRQWVRSSEHVRALGRLFVLLEEAGLALRHVSLTGCSRKHESSGCPEELTRLGYPCQTNRMCQNLLFAR